MRFQGASLSIWPVQKNTWRNQVLIARKDETQKNKVLYNKIWDTRCWPSFEDKAQHVNKSIIKDQSIMISMRGLIKIIGFEYSGTWLATTLYKWPNEGTIICKKRLVTLKNYKGIELVLWFLVLLFFTYLIFLSKN